MEYGERLQKNIKNSLGIIENKDLKKKKDINKTKD